MEELVDKTKVVELADKVKDDVTAYTGVVVAYAYHLHNCDRALIQSDGFHEGHPVKPIWFDVPSLIVLEKKVATITPVISREGEVRLGDEVRDQISKFEGVAACRGEWISGCVRIAVTGKALNPKTGEPLEDFWFPITQLDILKRAPSVETAPKATAKDKKEAKDQFTPSGWDKNKKPSEGVTAKHSDGKTWVFKDGKWEPKVGGPVREPKSTSRMPGR